MRYIPVKVSQLLDMQGMVRQTRATCALDSVSRGETFTKAFRIPT
jgi:hypothetical protein